MSCTCGSTYNNLPCCCKTGEPTVCLTTTCATAQPCNEVYQSDCVLYTGDPSSCLGITTGMTMTQVMNTLFTLVNTYYPCPTTTSTTTVAP